MLPALIRRSFYLNRILKKCLTYNKWKFVCGLSQRTRAFSSEDANKDKLDLVQFPAENIRNFSIVAHVDHGKSTLADRILELLGVISSKVQNKQVLDRLQVERERGITVKAQTASMVYKLDGTSYLFNLIDTPGHVDFSYEVSRSLAACQGVILLIDANQGVQAQTVANFYLAFEQDLMIIPVLNKIDLKNAQPDVVLKQLKNLFEMEPHEVLKISAKHGTGVEDVLQAVVAKIPSPTSERTEPLKALVFDCWYNQYRGVACNVALVNGVLRKGDKIQSGHSNKTYEVTEVGILRPHEVPTDILYAGQVGYLMCNMKESDEAKIGDTFYHDHSPVELLPSFRKAKPMVFAGLFPMDQSEFVSLRKAIEKLTLNDSSVSVHNDSSAALGQGWRLGFLGLLHMDVFQQRLEQEYNASVIITTPNVPYKVKLSGARHIKFYGAEEITILNPCELPDPAIISEYYEPMVLGTIIAPDTYIGSVMSLCMDKRGVPKDQGYIDDTRVIFRYILPLNEILVDFHDALKSVTSGYASFDYEDYGYQQSSLVKVTYRLNGNEVGELTMICHLSRARQVGKAVCAKLKETLPRKLFTISIQAYVGTKVIAREDIRAMKKDVLAKCYGGDITRKMKLLRRQAEGKERMRRIGNIDMPKDTFIKILKK